MKQSVRKKVEALAARPADMDQSVDYVASHMSCFLRKRDCVLICFAEHGLGEIFRRAVVQCGGIPVFWEPDRKWKTLLRQAFSNRVATIIAPPLVLLGLSKLAKATRTPLYVRNAVTAGYPCLDWMIDGIMRGLDCRIWGAFTLGASSVVGGFSCGTSRGVHLREDAYDFTILNKNGQPLPNGEIGTIAFAPKEMPGWEVAMADHGRLVRGQCLCGQPTLRLMDICPVKRFPEDVLNLYQQLHAWTSILDCRVTKGENGLELELVVFPGEKLPKLPSAAKLVIRRWDPDRDVPMDVSVT